MFEYVGALHIHSVFSDGSGEIQDIIKYANEAELDFIILTDHNTLRALDEGFEHWYDKILLLVGCEINDKENRNHYLAFGINKTLSTRTPAKEYVRKVKEAGAIGFLAHPNEKRNSMKEHPPYPWTEWDCEDFTGIEIWNHMSEWMEGLTEQNKYNYFIHPLKSIIGPVKETLEVWDKLNLKRKVVGIGGIDAHAHKVNVMGFVEFEVFPYKVLFKSIRTHILVKDKLNISKEIEEVKHSKEIIYEELSAGRCFVSNFYQGDAQGFKFFAEVNGRIYEMGDSIPHGHEIKLIVSLPEVIGLINLIYNGEIKESKESTKVEFTVSEKGVYRIEVYRENSAWIFSNHIRIGL